MSVENSVFESAVIEGLDFKKGLQTFPPGAYMDVLRTWCRHAPVSLEKLRALTKEGLSDEKVLKEYVVTVHGLKGSNYGICADGIGKLAEDLEGAGRRGDVAFIEANNEPMFAQTNAIYAKLQDFIAANTESAGAKSAASAPDPALLAEFLSACKQFKSNVMEDALKKLESFEYETGGDLVSWMREQLEDLEYDAIQERLEKELGA